MTIPLSDIVREVINDPSYLTDPLIDKALSFDGMMAGVGLSGLLFGTTMLTRFMSGGKKKWMSPYEAWRAKFYGDPTKGIVLGRYNGSLLCSTGNEGVGIDGTTGTGKTACSFLSTLLLNKLFGWLVFDQSGDLWQKTSGRRAEFGPTFQLNPGMLDTHCYNPLNDIPNDNRIVSNLTSLYEPLFAGSANDQKKTGGDPFFSSTGKSILPFITIQVLYGDDPSIKSIGGVLRYIGDGVECFEDMVDNPRHPQCEAVGRQMLSMSQPTRSSVMSVVSTALSLWRDDNICRMTEKSHFSIADLATSPSPITIFLTAPATDLKRMMPFYVVIEEMMKLHLMSNAKTTLMGVKKVRPVCVADDEAQNTKRPSIDSLEIQRKFGIRSMLGYQSLYAMGQLYGEDKLGLLRTKVSYRPPADKIYVDKLIDMSGTYKKKVVSESQNRGEKLSHGKSWRIEERPRLTKLDLEEWPAFGRALLTHMGGSPAIISTFDTEHDKEFSHLITVPAFMWGGYPIRSHWDGYHREVIVRSHPPVEDDRLMSEEDNRSHTTSSEESAPKPRIKVTL